MKAVIYARYSSDLQSKASIDDQVRICRERADRMDIEVVDVFADAALSGSRLQNRPSIQKLLERARTPGSFDVVITEALDRLSRDQEDIAGLFKRLAHLDIRIHTLSEGDINELHVGLKGTMNALFLKDLANKVRRGQRGRAEASRAAGGLSYGYRVLREIGANGEVERGRREIDPEAARIICHIFEEYVAGRSPRAIAADLNRDGVPSPRGGSWNASTINGNRKRRHGILLNTLYAGKMEYGRLSYRKDPDTGSRQPRVLPQDKWVLVDVPEWRIVSEELWRQAQAMRMRHAGKPSREARRPRHLLSGLIRCGQCGGAYTMRSSDRLGCVAHRESGTCNNNRTVLRTELESRVLGGIKERLLTPSLFEEFARQFRETSEQLHRERDQRNTTIGRKLCAVQSSIDRIVNAIAEGTASKSLKAKLDQLETERERVESEHRAIAAERRPPELHPSLPEIYRRRVNDLEAALTRTEMERAAASEILRSLIIGISVYPGRDRGEVKIKVEGSVPDILEFAARQRRHEKGAKGEQRPNRNVVLVVPRILLARFLHDPGLAPNSVSYCLG